MRLGELLQHAQDPSRLGSRVAFLFRLRLIGLPPRQLRMVEVIIQLAVLADHRAVRNLMQSRAA